MLLATGVPVVHATVEENWPAGSPNIPRNADDIFIDFETGIDGIQIESTIPSLKFTTTLGLDWVYGDIRTDKYNVYPYNAQNYETNGNFFAWLDTTGDMGRIDFLGGGATYCSVLVSTLSGLTLDAYNSEDVLISTSGWATNNINTRTFTRLTVDAPAGETISYVMIHDSGNYWLIDDLCSDANKAVMPVPGRSIGSHSDKFDIVFIPDHDYGLPADIDTWLPTFLDHINDQIDDRLDAAAPVTGNLCKFNFYYTKMQGTASSKTLPADLTLLAPFTDAYVIFHTAVFGDSCSMGTPSIYGAEGEISAATQNGRSFIHESGHGIFGLADEYDGCGTYYFQPDPMPNIWATETDGRDDATSEGWDPDEIWMFTECQGDWWKLGTTRYIMYDGTYFANGWGVPGSRRIQWFFDQFPACEAGEAAEASAAEKAIWLDLEVSSGEFSLLDESFVAGAPPNYLPGSYDFSVDVYSNSGELIGKYGINDPRRIVAESDYVGPTWLDDTNFQLIVPYFNNIGRVDLVENETGDVEVSVDVSGYATVFPKVTLMYKEKFLDYDFDLVDWAVIGEPGEFIKDAYVLQDNDDTGIERIIGKGSFDTNLFIKNLDIDMFGDLIFDWSFIDGSNWISIKTYNRGGNIEVDVCTSEDGVIATTVIGTTSIDYIKYKLIWDEASKKANVYYSTSTSFPKKKLEGSGFVFDKESTAGKKTRVLLKDDSSSITLDYYSHKLLGCITNLDNWEEISGDWAENLFMGKQGNAKTEEAIILAGTVGTDFIYEANMLIPSGTDTGGYLVFRSGDNPNEGCYLAGITLEDGGKVQLYKNPLYLMAESSVAIEAGKTYNIRVIVIGPEIQVYLDEELVLEAVDYDYTEGRFGLMTINGRVYFQNVFNW
jgi:hypothetical protein